MLNVLLVDDNHENRFLNARLLRQFGCTVTEFPDPLLPLQLLKMRNPFDVIFTDLNMPRMNGIEFFDLIRQSYPDVPVVITSATDYPNLAAQVRDKQTVQCLFGVFKRDSVQQILTSITNKSRLS